MTHLTESRDALAKALWVLQATDESLSSEWADRAWGDMGGSEPSEERVDAELLADALIGSGAVIDASTLADDEALPYEPCQPRYGSCALPPGHNGPHHGYPEDVALVFRALAAALTERSQS